MVTDSDFREFILYIGEGFVIDVKNSVNGAIADALPLVSSHVNGIRGDVKVRPADFLVREIPLYDLEGDGPHLYFEVRKEDVTTDAAVRALAKHMDVSPDVIGYAGRKDRTAITTQRMSLEHADEQRLESFEHGSIDVEVLGWHRNKLKPGHLLGNHFQIKIRNTAPDSLALVEETFGVLRDTGLPNYFGEQRFGRRGDTARLGRLMVSDQLSDFVSAYFGNPRPADPPDVFDARGAFDEGNLEEAIDHWPDGYRIKRRALAAYIDRESPKPVLSTIPKSRRSLFVSAFQSQLFNEQVATRIDTLDRVFEGGIAKKTDTGGMFRVEDPDREQPRADRFEISPTGSLPGEDCWKAEGEQGELERGTLAQYDLTYEDFETVSYLGNNGARRPLRVKPRELNAGINEDEFGEYLDVSFQVPSGSYATVLLRELQRPETVKSGD